MKCWISLSFLQVKCGKWGEKRIKSSFFELSSWVSGLTVSTFTASEWEEVIALFFLPPLRIGHPFTYSQISSLPNLKIYPSFIFLLCNCLRNYLFYNHIYNKDLNCIFLNLKFSHLNCFMAYCQSFYNMSKPTFDILILNLIIIINFFWGGKVIW